MVAKVYGPPIPVEPKTTPSPKTQSAGTFRRILQESFEGLSFSVHAAKRLQQRAAPLSSEDVSKLTNAVDRAAGKGARESLVLLDDLAFIVSITNRKVITTIDRESLRDNVITNIDSAVIA